LAPQGGQEILPAALQLPEPFMLGQRVQDAAGEVFVPDPQLGQLIGRPAPKQRGEHHPKDFSQQLHLGLQTPLDFGYQGFRQSQVDQRLLHSLQVSLRAPLLMLQPLAVLPEVTLLGVRLPSLGLGHRGHGLLL
jgi:hypothetical protein